MDPPRTAEVRRGVGWEGRAREWEGRRGGRGMREREGRRGYESLAPRGAPDVKNMFAC